MRTFFTALALSLAAAAALTGCPFNIGPYAAVVDGTTISQQELTDSVSSAAANAAYLCSVTSGYQVPLTTKGAGTGTYDVNFVDFVLRTLVRAKLSSDEVSRRHLSVTSFLDPIAKEQLGGSLGSAVPGCSGTGASVMAQLSPVYRNALLNFYENLDALGAARQGIVLTNAGISQYANQHPEFSQVVCLNYIQAASMALAQHAIAEVTKGTPFTTVAAHTTAATSTTIPCTPLGQFPPQISSAIASLAVGGMTAPIIYQQNIYIFQLSARQPATPEQFIATIVANVQSSFPAVIAEIDASGSVRLDPAYGSWSRVSSNSGPISPPPAPPDKFVPAPSVVVAAPSPIPNSPGVPPAGGAG